MDILTLLRTIIRRWLVVVPIVVATLAAAYVVGTGSEPEYGMEGTGLLVSEAGTLTADREGDGFAAVSAPVLAETLRSTAARSRLTGAGAVVPYEVEVDPDTSILRVTANSADPGANVRTVEVVLDNLATELELLETTAEVPQAGRATIKQLSRPADQPNAGAPSAVGSAFLIPKGPAQPNPYPPGAYTARIVEERMLSAQYRARVIERAGGAATFEVTQNQRDEAPIIYLAVTGTQPATVERVFAAAAATVDELLLERQEEAGVAEGDRTRMVLLNTPSGATRTSGTVVKTVVTIVGLGLIAAATAAVVVESLLTSARPHRRHEEASEEQPSRSVEPMADDGQLEVGDGTTVPGSEEKWPLYYP